MSNDGLGEDLTAYLFSKSPECFGTHNPKENGRACGAVAQLLGCLLSAVLSHHGEDKYKECLKMMLAIVDENAREVVKKAGEINKQKAH